MALRCPWCARRVADSQELCPHCTAELVPASSWPAARMLVDAGVDRIALPERVRTLDEPTKKRLERTFELQACLVRARLVEAASLSTALRDPELVDAVGDTLWPLLPILPLTSSAARTLGGPDPRSLTTNEEITALVLDDDGLVALRRLGAVVLHRREAGTRETARLLREALWTDDAIAREAALALAPPSLLLSPFHGVDQHDSDRVIAALTAATKVPLLADEAAVSLCLLVVEQRPILGERLRRIVGDRRAPIGVRLGAAIALDDVDAVFDLLELLRLDDRDAERALQAQALRFLLQRRSDDRTLAATLRRFDDDDRHAALALLRRPGPLTRHEALRDIETRPLPTRAAILDLYKRSVPASEVRTAELTLLAGGLDDVDIERLLALLDLWPRDHDGRRSAEGSAPLIAALARTIAADPEAMAEHRLIGTIIDKVRGDDVDEVRAIFGPLLRRRTHAARVLDRALGSLTRDEPIALVTTLWTLSADVAEAIAGWTEATARWSARDDVIAWFWRRFVDHVDERAAIVAGTAGWRRALREHRDQQPREARAGGGSAVGHLAVWLPIDEDVLTVVDDAFALADVDDLVDVVAPIMRHAHALLDRGVYRLAVVTAFRLGAKIEHALRDDLRRLNDEDSDDNDDDDDIDIDSDIALRASLLAAHDAWERAVAAFIIDAEARSGDDVDGARHFLDDIAVERRLLGEDREEADAIRERRAQARKRRRDRQTTTPASTSTPTSTATPPWTPPPPPVVVLPLPDFVPTGLDIEPFDAGLGLPTLLSYAQVLVAMQRGHDTFGIFAAAGLDVAGWVAAATRWGERFRLKPAVAMRFGVLIQLPWRDV